MNIIKLLMAAKSEEVLGSEEYDSVFINNGFETYTIDGLDITSAIDSFLGGKCYDNIALDVGKTYKITFDYVYNSGTNPTYRVASNADLNINAVLNEQLVGTGTYTFYSLGQAYHGFDSAFSTSFEVYNLSVKEVL